VEPIDEFRIKSYNRMSQYRNGIIDMNYMAVDLAETSNFEEVIQKISKYVLNIECEEFYLCLCDGWRSTYDSERGFIDTIITDGYTQSMLCMLSYRDGKFNTEPFTFNSADMTPNRETLYYSQGTGGNVYYYAPIHFNEKCLGYCIIGNSTFPLHSPMYHSWIVNLSNCIENIRNKLSLEHMVNELDRLYVVDNLSKIYNRNGFYRFANDIYLQSARDGEEVMVLFIDLDGLKYVNDKFGHHEGDHAILTVAETIRKCCTHGEVFARFGGDEFVIFASNYTDVEAKALCYSIEEKFIEYNESSEKPYKVGASMGYHITVADENIPIANIISIADSKMYELKKKRRKNRGMPV
jgi:diguanylate cyclase (GGDEF)-like protein